MKNAGMLLAGSLLLAMSLTTYHRLEARETPTATNKPNTFVECREPRPEICYEIYAPVCAVRDTGVRCITTPCPSEEKAAYSNDCTACADPKVRGYTTGRCAN